MKEEGRRKREEGRRKKEEGRGKKEDRITKDEQNIIIFSEKVSINFGFFLFSFFLRVLRVFAVR
ncbi:hypothetical protein QUB08_18430 [Microcoleus sp. BR0-C5]|uniref:hypothetical protein n=1 Tax=Microcoleus sp. BR0-C5 TaxID=2818713 RepID=UPI002FD71468